MPALSPLSLASWRATWASQMAEAAAEGLAGLSSAAEIGRWSRAEARSMRRSASARSGKTRRKSGRNVVPAGARHNVINTGSGPLKFYTVYGPPEHRDGTVHATKADAREEHFDGKTTE